MTDPGSGRPARGDDVEPDAAMREADRANGEPDALQDGDADQDGDAEHAVGDAAEPTDADTP